jgi:hypothetical protein
MQEHHLLIRLCTDLCIPTHPTHKPILQIVPTFQQCIVLRLIQILFLIRVHIRLRLCTRDRVQAHGVLIPYHGAVEDVRSEGENGAAALYEVLSLRQRCEVREEVLLGREEDIFFEHGSEGLEEFGVAVEDWGA